MDKAVGSKKILITGAAGFIGFHLAKLRLEQGDTVHGIDNLNNYYDVLLKKKTTYPAVLYKISSIYS
tara:strand:- start:657 stop:857 length:201 start_codon:yes stop_codon:yes gene_type:complete